MFHIITIYVQHVPPLYYAILNYIFLYTRHHGKYVGEVIQLVDELQAKVIAEGDSSQVRGRTSKLCEHTSISTLKCKTAYIFRRRIFFAN